VDEAWKAQKGITAGCPVVSEIRLSLHPLASDADKASLRERMQALRERITKGEAFAQVARETSNAPSAAFGGFHGCLGEGYGPGADVLVEAAQKLSPGALSDVLETPVGVHLVRLERKLDAAEVETFGKQQIGRSLYLASAQKDAAQAFATELIEQTKAGAKLEEVTKTLTDELARRSSKTPAPAGDEEPSTLPALLAPDRPRFEVSPPFTISGNPLPDVAALEPLAARAFELNEPDAVDERPIQTQDGLVVIQLKEKTPAAKEDFEKEKWALLRVLNERKAGEALVRYVADLRRAAGSKLKVDASYAEEAKPEANE
jgi:parvulin-like peptidyl-prolyl isomerase